MKCSDIYMVCLDPIKGKEQSGARPIVIISPDSFNQKTKLPVVLPITNGGRFAGNIGFAAQLIGTKTTGIIRCDQPRVLDLQARHGKKVEMLPEALLADVLARVSTIFA